MLLSHDSLQNDYSKTPQKLNITSVGHDMGGQYAIAEDKDTSLHTPPPLQSIPIILHKNT
jgi:hypothetical protein